MNKSSIVKIHNALVVTLQGEIDDRTALELQQEILQSVIRYQVSGVVIEISQLDLVDSYMARILSETARMIKLMGAETFLAGLRPMVAVTIVEMGLNIDGVKTALNLEVALEVLKGGR
ncbi:STAS domain-containing protein [Heliobacillus mobilis]|uniref:STAS domain-containing protein n=1 Tax=Heliobacterium mobile TaxID=28064 RepID=A0A6I3SS24_HELMO|nr:STAS domain-containing protein [Heliobacterium mobile]MTV50857.1 STAS domain-containing protein [Heliobacterium mobile]